MVLPEPDQPAHSGRGHNRIRKELLRQDAAHTRKLCVEHQRGDNRLGGRIPAWVKQTGGVVVSLGKGDYLNIMDLSGMKPIDRAKQIVTSFEILTDIAQYPEQKRLTQEAIEQAYVEGRI